MEELLEKIKINEFLNNINSLDAKSPDYEKKARVIISSYAEELENIIANEDIAFAVAVLDLISHNSNLLLFLIQRRNSKILNAQLVLEKIRGINAEKIQNSLENTKADFYLMFGGKVIGNPSLSAKYDRIYEILHEYLRDKENVDEMQNRLTLDFYKNIESIAPLILANFQNTLLPRGNFIDSLFELDDVDTISNVFNNVINKSKLFSTYDYENIILNNSVLLFKVKGLFRKCNHNFFDIITSIDKKHFKELSNFFREMSELNKDDEEGLKWFFFEIERRSKDKNSLASYLRKQDYYRKYVNVNINEVYEKNLQIFLNNDANIDESVIEKIGSYKGVIEHFAELLKLFYESKDNNYKRKLILPLVVALIEKEKKKGNVQFEIVFNSNKIDPHEFGHYCHDDKALYINPLIFNAIEDLDFALVSAFDTAFHEVRHACQYQEAESSQKFDYDNLVRAMDFILRKDFFGEYYASNYEHISYERDAREVAYVNCMMIFKDYPKLLELSRNFCDKKSYSLSDYMRKSSFAGMEKYYGIIPKFIEEVNDSFKWYLKEKKFDLLEDYIESLKEYPVILQFFDLDEENLTFKVKDKNYFDKMREKARKMPDSLEKRQIEYSLKAFDYGLRVGEFLSSKNEYINAELSGGYNEKLIEEVIDAVGRGVTK